MPGNVRNENLASDHRLRNQVDGTAFTNSSHRHSTPNFRGSKRVSHRRSQRQHNSADQYSNIQLSNEIPAYHERGTAFNSHGSNTVQNSRISNIAVKLSNPSNRIPKLVYAEDLQEVIHDLNKLNIRNDNSRYHNPSATFNTNNHPTNFRDLDLYPTKNDIHRSGMPPLERNITKGAYDNVEHYLNVQFHLLREDFVGSVRKGVQHYKSMSSNSPNPSQLKYDGIRIYPRTQFERIKSTKNNKLGILLNFDPDGKMRNFRWKEAKRFMYGSLLLFTVTDFSAFFLCTVIESDIDGLKQGKVLVSLADNVKTDSRFFKRPYLMAECEAFFDPYFLVMKLLREFDENTFPMTRYIVKGAIDSQYPAYLRDFGVLMAGKRIIAPITTDDDDWPTAEEMQLDQYQLRAFKAALTRDFCVIQGPPGTGKTFIGLKIVQAIWHNAKSFNHKLQLPILVVCSANHAVDQFLEGVLKFTKNVVRVGGQSRSEVMKKYNLRERAKAENKFFTDKLLIGKIKSCQRDIDRIGLMMKCAEKPTGILSAKVLSDVVEPKYEQLVRSDKTLIQWLLPSERLCKRYDESAFIKFKSDNEIKKVAPVKKSEVNQSDDDDDDDEDETCDPQPKPSYEVDESSCYCISLQELGRKCIMNIDQYYELKQRSRGYANYGNISAYENESIRIMKLFDNLKDQLNNPIHNEDLVHRNQLLNLDPHCLSVNERWLIYWQWTLQLVAVLSKELKELERSHSESVQELEESRQQKDLAVMQRADVVGMTTNGAARLNRLLKSLHPAVVVIEEAGEVLESHVIASLTSKCQHVILIGDHEQLRPITAVYEMSVKYNMDVSLFERMVKNGMDCPVLNVQHRMRPEISCLISPLIYKDLKNHESVLKFESVRGVEKNVFFVDHSQFEHTADSSSKQNEHEAKFVIHLAIYLIKQQYDPTKITILTTYAAQRNLLRNLQKEYSLDSGVKCSVVDKYQGEENDIVLLSLVRSNAAGNIGFLETKNRVCVGLSRAKIGFFMIGNMSCLAKRSPLWQNIKKTLTDNDAIGKELPLYCSIHEKRTLVASDADFTQVKDGGCDAKCNQRLACGHICPSGCHYTFGVHPKIWCCISKLKVYKCGHESPEDPREPKSEYCGMCRKSVQYSRKPSYTARNYSQDSSSLRRSFGSSPTFPKHSYSFAPIVPLKRRSFFSGCCLL